MNELIDVLTNPGTQQDFPMLTSCIRLGYAFVLTFGLALTYKA